MGGVGLLVAGVDPQFQTPHLYQTCPSGNMYEFFASAVGARSQSARTYLEKHYESFPECELDDLIVHTLQALVGCVTGDDELTKENGSIAFLGKDQKYTLLEGDALQPYLDRLEVKNVEEEKDEEEESSGDEPQDMET